MAAQARLHKGKELICQVSENPDRGSGDGHGRAPHFGRKDFRNNYPANGAITYRVTSNERHYACQNPQAGASDPVKGRDNAQSQCLHIGAQENERFAPSSIHKPNCKKSEHQIDNTDQYCLEKSVGSAMPGAFEYFGQEREQTSNAARL